MNADRGGRSDFSPIHRIGSLNVRRRPPTLLAADFIGFKVYSRQTLPLPPPRYRAVVSASSFVAVLSIAGLLEKKRRGEGVTKLRVS